jgi:hypothetical protein
VLIRKKKEKSRDQLLELTGLKRSFDHQVLLSQTFFLVSKKRVRMNEDCSSGHRKRGLHNKAII